MLSGNTPYFEINEFHSLNKNMLHMMAYEIYNHETSHETSTRLNIWM